MLVRRTLPNRDRRMVGAWCFVDSYGPTDITDGPGMQVPPHPHTGLQTVSWLVGGGVLHRDSLGTTQLIRPGALGLMTAGRGISHSEESPADHGAVLHGVQLWVALPNEHRWGPAAFAHHADLPTIVDAGGTLTVIMGKIADTVSPARTYTPIVGAEATVEAGGQLRVPVEPDFEHAVLAVSDGVSVEGRPVSVGSMLYLGCGRRHVDIAADVPARALLLGGLPFDEQLVMWWNFVGRSHEEIRQAREQWEGGRTATGDRAATEQQARFGVVHGYDGPPLAAPVLPNAQLRPRGRSRDTRNR